MIKKEKERNLYLIIEKLNDDFVIFKTKFRPTQESISNAH
jgi:hypothetical protein